MRTRLFLIIVLRMVMIFGLVIMGAGCTAAAPALVPIAATGPVGTVIAITIFVVGSVIVAVVPTGSQAPADVPKDAVALEFVISNPTFTFEVGKLVVLWDTQVTSKAYPTEQREQATRITVTSDDRGCNGVALVEQKFEGIWTPVPVGDFRFAMPKPNCTTGDRTITKEVLMAAYMDAVAAGLTVMSQIIDRMIYDFPK